MRLILFLSILAVVVLSYGSSNSSKVSPELRKIMMIKNTIDILVMIDEIDSVLASVTSKYTKATTHGEKANAVHQALTVHATITQKATLEFLSTKKSTNQIKSYWVNNMIWVEGADHDLIMTLATRSEVSEIHEDGIITLNDQVVDSGEFPSNKQNLEWGIRKIRAPEAWETTAGAGAIVGVIDTGARYTHTIINHSFMGNNATKFAWFNPFRPADPNPTDLHGHGTHVTGILVGNNGVGVAHEAKWISCKGMTDNGNGNTAAIIACFQFMACPHIHSDPNGQKDCTQAPHLVSNSWGSYSGNSAFDAAINTWHAVNIWPVFGGGNGPLCSTIRSPADSVSGVISVGATQESEAKAAFSGRGPVRQTEIAPRISAPGQNVRSAGIASDTAYTIMSGDPMAAPHVAGVLALIKSHKSNQLLYQEAKQALESSANKTAPVGLGQTCGGVTDLEWPNNSFGHGRIDAVTALAAV